MPKRRSPCHVPAENLASAAECLRTMAHPIRLRILQLIARGSYTVGELAQSCQIPSHRASEHLGLMRDRGLLRSERRGQQIYYRLAEKSLRSILRCIENRYGEKNDKK
jgi:DNA-binding transcriptional ArsR family regulator